MQIEITMRYNLTLLEWLFWTRQMISVGEIVEKKELLFTADENVNWYSHYGKQYGGSSKNLE